MRAIRCPVASRGSGDYALLGQCRHAGQQLQRPGVEVGAQAGTPGQLQRVAQQSEAGDVGQGMHSVQRGQIHAGGVQLRGGRHHGLVAGGLQQVLLERGGQDAHAQGFAQHQQVAGLRRGIALQACRIDDADAHQAIDGLHRVDGVAARQRNTRRAAHRLAAFEDLGDRLVRQHVDGHAHDGQCHQRLAAHGIDVRQRIGGGDAAEVEGIVHDRHEEVGGGHDGLPVVDAVHRRVVSGLAAHQQVGEELRRQAAARQQLAEHTGGDLAAAAAAMGQRSEAGWDIGGR